MKRILAVFLSVFLLLTSLMFCLPAFAEGDGDEPVICEFCKKTHNVEADGNCYCCHRCPYLDTDTMNTDRLIQCTKDPSGHYLGHACCDRCTGIFPCNCSKRSNSTCKCKWCADQAQDNEEPYKEVVSQRAKTTFSSIFQNVMKKISSVFDRMFTVVFIIFGIKN